MPDPSPSKVLSHTSSPNSDNSLNGVSCFLKYTSVEVLRGKRNLKNRKRGEQRITRSKVQERSVEIKIRFDNFDSDNQSSLEIKYNNWQCNELGKDEVWYCCSGCKEWADAECTPITTKGQKWNNGVVAVVYENSWKLVLSTQEINSYMYTYLYSFLWKNTYIIL